MQDGVSRRNFLRTAAAAGLATGAASYAGATDQAAAGDAAAPAADTTPSAAPFEISLAEWSLHRTLWSGKMTNLDFPVAARQQFGIGAVEYVNGFFKDKANDQAYLTELKTRCEGEGVRSLLIMCDGEGKLGDPAADRRRKAVENHHRWIDAAKFLGCHSIRVNASSAGSYEEQQKLAADGLAQLGEHAAKAGLNVLVENHGGLSSSGVWLAGVMRLVGRDNVGTLPDFGNFRISRVELGEGDAKRQVENRYDRYQGVAELMPFAKAVSAKSYAFDADGNETQTDYFRMLKLVTEAGYSGYVGVEWEGNAPGESQGILLTKKLLERVRASMA
ncbi:MAG: sugar phosphate isomerase/epimerase family protein [Planctomycetota bacterium]